MIIRLWPFISHKYVCLEINLSDVLFMYITSYLTQLWVCCDISNLISQFTYARASWILRIQCPIVTLHLHRRASTHKRIFGLNVSLFQKNNSSLDTHIFFAQLNNIKYTVNLAYNVPVGTSVFCPLYTKSVLRVYRTLSVIRIYRTLSVIDINRTMSGICIPYTVRYTCKCDTVRCTTACLHHVPSWLLCIQIIHCYTHCVRINWVVVLPTGLHNLLDWVLLWNNDNPWQTTKFQWCSSWKLITMTHLLYWQNYMYSKLHACKWTAPRNSARSRLTRRTSSATVCYAACRIIVHVHCIFNSWVYQSRHATENWKNESGQSSVMLKNAFDFYVE